MPDFKQFAGEENSRIKAGAERGRKEGRKGDWLTELGPLSRVSSDKSWLLHEHKTH